MFFSLLRISPSEVGLNIQTFQFEKKSFQHGIGHSDTTLDLFLKELVLHRLTFPRDSNVEELFDSLSLSSQVIGRKKSQTWTKFGGAEFDFRCERSFFLVIFKTGLRFVINVRVFSTSAPWQNSGPRVILTSAPLKVGSYPTNCWLQFRALWTLNFSTLALTS